jgi:hypothetical protein
MDIAMKLVALLRNGNRNSAIVVSFARLITSFIGAFLFNIPWLVLFISFGKSPGEIIRVVLWCMAPLIVAIGYSCGIVIYNRIVSIKSDSLLLILPWPLFGCILGEIITVSSGPMVTGLSIFIFGGIAVLLREVGMIYKKRRGT